MPFPSLDDLLAQISHLAQSHSDQVELFSYGQSRTGEPLHALRIGTGPRRVLAYAFPQPDEPLGGLVILRLLERLLEAVCPIPVLGPLRVDDLQDRPLARFPE